MGIFDQVIGEKSVFRNEGILDYTYIPSKIQYRDNEQREIASSIKPLLFNRLPRNIYVYGPPGVGKTICTKLVLEDLKEYTSELITCYVDLWSYRTTNAIYTEIARQMNMPFVSGRSSDFIAERIRERIDAKKGAIFVFDEVDKSREQMFLYDVLTNFNKVCVIIITNDPNYMMKIDQRVSSRLTPLYLEFKPYSRDEIREILEERKKIAFLSGTINEEAFEPIIDETHRYKDIRLGLFLLSEAGKIADYNFSDVVKKEHSLDAIKRIGMFKSKTSTVGLNDEEKTILSIVGEKPGIPTSDLYKIYTEKKGNLSDRSLRRYLEKLTALNMLEVREVRGGIRGRAFQAFLK